MAAYCYTTKDGTQTVERHFPMGKAQRSVRLASGKRAYRDYRAEQAGGSTVTEKGYPMESDAMGVFPRQIKAAGEAALKAGVPTQFTKDGAAILTSKQHRRRFARSIGFHDRNAGYGDPTPD